MEKWQDPETLALWLGIIIIVFIGLVVAIILFTQTYFKRIIHSQQLLAEERFRHQEELAETSVATMERERHRVSLELHDAIISRLNTALLLTSASDLKNEVPKLLSSCIQEIRQISHDLHPPMLENEELPAIITESVLTISNEFAVDKWIRNYGIDKLPFSIKLHLIRIYQECINNIIRHSGADRISIKLRLSSYMIVLIIEDNGVGVGEIKRNSGLGMQNIALRSQILKGRFKVKSKVGFGTTIIVVVPINDINDEF